MPKFKLAVILLVTFALGACCTPYSQSFCCEPDDCPQAKDGFARYASLISALEVYKKNNDQYPESLEELKPKYIEHILIGEGDKFSYAISDGKYELSFTYYGPGANICSYTSEVSKWSCSGYF